jgi:hypothetical protein
MADARGKAGQIPDERQGRCRMKGMADARYKADAQSKTIEMRDARQGRSAMHGKAYTRCMARQMRHDSQGSCAMQG